MCRRAHGLPFYLEELAAASAGAGGAVAGVPPEQVVPESVRDAVAQQVARLSEPEQVASARRTEGDGQALARVERRLAGVYELANDWQRALAARLVAAVEFARAGLALEAATERLAAAGHLQADLTTALRLVQQAEAGIDAASASAAEPAELRARAMGLEGLIRAKLGATSAGVELARQALDLALDSDLEGVTAEVYYLYADALEQATATRRRSTPGPTRSRSAAAAASTPTRTSAWPAWSRRCATPASGTAHWRWAARSSRMRSGSAPCWRVTPAAPPTSSSVRSSCSLPSACPLRPRRPRFGPGWLWPHAGSGTGPSSVSLPPSTPRGSSTPGPWWPPP